MRHFWQFFLVAVICVIFAGCGGSFLPAMPPREPITFDYAPTTEAAPGSAEVTFVVIGTQLAKPIQQNAAQAPFNVQSSLLDDFANAMTNDFMEVLNARGYSVTGPYKTYSEIIHPVKEGNDLLLTAEVNFISNTRDIRIGRLVYVDASDTRHFKIIGSVNVICDVKLVLSECLTNEPMWTKNVTLDPFEVVMDSIYPFYGLSDLQSLAVQYGKISVEGLESMTNGMYSTLVFPNCPIGVFLEKDNKFHSDLGRALKMQYKEILGVVYTYLDPREMAIEKNQAVELRKRKVF